MSDNAEQGVDDQRDAENQEHQDESSTSDDLGEKGKAAIKAERDARKKAETELADMRKRIEGFEARQREADEAKQKEDGEYKALLEKRDAELEDLKNSLADRDLNDLKRKVGKHKDFGLPDDLIDRLQGTTEDEIREDAKKLAAFVALKDGPDTDAGKRGNPGGKPPKSESVLATYQFGKRR